MKKIEINRPMCFDSLNESVILLASYPRSGNTWTCNLLEDILSTDSQKKIIYDIHSENNIFQKSHHNFFSNIIKSHYLDFKKNNKVIYIFRRADDVIPSYLRFHKYQGYSGYAPPYSFSLVNCFLIEILNHWKIALKMYKSNQNKIIFIPYEGLHCNALAYMKMCIDFIGSAINADCLDKAIKNNSFYAMKNKNAVYTEIHNGEVFLKYGTIGSGKNHLSFFHRFWIFIISNFTYLKMNKISQSQLRSLAN